MDTNFLIGLIFGVLIPVIVGLVIYYLSPRLKSLGLIISFMMMLSGLEYFRSLDYIEGWYIVILLIIIAGGYTYYLGKFWSGD